LPAGLVAKLTLSCFVGLFVLIEPVEQAPVVNMNEKTRNLYI